MHNPWTQQWGEVLGREQDWGGEGQWGKKRDNCNTFDNKDTF